MDDRTKHKNDAVLLENSEHKLNGKSNFYFLTKKKTKTKKNLLIK